MQILGLLAMYFDDVVVEVKTFLLLFRLALAVSSSGHTLILVAYDLLELETWVKEVCNRDIEQNSPKLYYKLSEVTFLLSTFKLIFFQNELTTLPHGLIFLNSLNELSLRENPLVMRFVREMAFKPASLLELSARVIKNFRCVF